MRPVLSLLKPQSYASGGVALHEDMAIQWPAHAGIKCYAVVSGRCWLSVDGMDKPLLLQAGDWPLPRSKQNGRRPGNCFPAGRGRRQVRASPPGAAWLLSSLPPVVSLQRPESKAAMRWALDQMTDEVRQPRPGSALIVQQLAWMIS